MRKGSMLLVIGLLFFIAMAGYTGYLYWSHKKDLDRLSLVEASLEDFKKNQVHSDDSEVLQAITAKKTVATLEMDLIVWSDVMRAIIATLPKENNRPIVNIVSYSGSDKKEISMNVKTSPTSEDPYQDVALLIASFDESESFDEVFVPSISSGNDAEGREILSFLLSVTFTGESVNDPTVDPVSEPISR